MGDTADDNRRSQECGEKAGIGTDGKRRRGSSVAGPELDHSEREGLEIRNRERAEQLRQESEPIAAGLQAGIFPPGPKDDDAWVRILQRAYWLRPAISEEEIESALCDCPDRLADLVVSQRTDALRACGNGVVALQGAIAFVELMRRMSYWPGAQ